MEENPYETPKSDLSTPRIGAWSQPQVRKAARIAWLCFFLISGVGGMVVGGLVGAAVGAGLGMAGWSIEAIQIATFVLGIVLGVPISYFVFLWSIRRFIVPAFDASMSAARL